jgi:integrase
LAKVSVIQTGTYWFSVAGIEVASARPSGNRKRRVDMSKDSAKHWWNYVTRMLGASQAGMPLIADDLVFPGEKSTPISVRTLSENYLLPSLERANLRRFRFHDLRHTFGSLLIEAGAPLPYVRDQMGHSSTQITADKYVHLLAGRNVCFIDRLDALKHAQPKAGWAMIW